MWWVSFCYCLNIPKTIFLKISLSISLTLHYFWRISTMPKKIIRRVVQDKKIQLQPYRSLLKLLKELDFNTSTLLKEIKGILDLLNLAIANASLIELKWKCLYQGKHSSWKLIQIHSHYNHTRDQLEEHSFQNK